METKEKTKITVEATINAPVEKVWTIWTDPKHIVKWSTPSGDWHTSYAENDLRTGGKFMSRMEAKDGSMGFDFSGEYSKVEKHKQIEYAIADGRKVTISFAPKDGKTVVTETFETETINPVEMQRGGWQAILDSFKKHVETVDRMELQHFEIRINAPLELVYRTMLDEKHYKEWTAEFNPTSSFKGSWNKGSKILFLGTDKDGNTEGMVSWIKENIPNKYVSIEHKGFVKNGKEVTSGPEVDGWAGALENYTFTRDKDQTLVSVDIDVNQEYKSYFQDTWPKALNKLKSICEKLVTNKQ